jgi:iron(III) transport system ATP-binding protein
MALWGARADPTPVAYATVWQVTWRFGAVLAARPTEIEFASEAGVRGVVARKAFLGETIDYRIAVGDLEVRVQKTRQTPGPAVGESCGLHFPRARWYPPD